MNRRELLIGIGAMACSNGAKPPVKPIQPTTSDGGVTDSILTASQLRANAIAMHGDVLVQSAGDELWVWDALAMKRGATYALPHRAFALLADGSIAAYAKADPARCAVSRITNDTVEAFTTPLCGSITRHAGLLLRGPTRDEVYIVRDDEVAIGRLSGVHVEITATLALPARNAANRAQMFAFEDGRVVAPGNGLHVLAPDRPPESHAMRERTPVHLAPAGTDQLWYSCATGPEQWRLNALVLAPIATPATELHRLDVSPHRIVHLSSGGGAVALLLAVHADRYTIAVIDDAGRERWRADVPSSFATSPGALNAMGFVAISQHRVVLRGENHAVLAWDAANGAPITPAI